MIYKILLLKIYSFSNYKTNIFKFFLKKKSNIIINNIYYFINNLYYYKKNFLSSNIYMYICNYYIKNNCNNGKYFFLDNKNFYSFELIKNYNLYEINFFYNKTKIKKNISLKILKKIFTNVLVKKKNIIFESLKERYIITFLYIFINFTQKIKKILRFYLNFFDDDIFFFLKNVKKICSIIHLNKEEYNSKIHIGMMKNQNNNFPYYLFFIINNLIKKKKYKIEISFEIYNFDIIKIIKKCYFFKKIKIILYINIPDLFFEYFIKNKNWFLIDNLSVKKYYNFYLQSFYDEYIGIGSFRILYKKIIKNINIKKIEINSRKIMIFLLKNKINIYYSDGYNRKNNNKHNGPLLSNFYHNKIFDRNNYFKRYLSFFKNMNFFMQRNNTFYIETKIKQKIDICNKNKKKIFKNIKILNLKNDFLIIERETNFHSNYRLMPINIIINKINKKKNNYLNFNCIKINSYLSSNYVPYCWYQGSDYYNFHYFYRYNFTTNKWKSLFYYVEKHRLKCSLFLIKIKNKNNNTTFDKYYIKNILLKWQLNETYKF